MGVLLPTKKRTKPLLNPLVWQRGIEIRRIGKEESRRCAKQILAPSSLRKHHLGTRDELCTQTFPAPLTNSYRRLGLNQTLIIATRWDRPGKRGEWPMSPSRNLWPLYRLRQSLHCSTQKPISSQHRQNTWPKW